MIKALILFVLASGPFAWALPPDTPSHLICPSILGLAGGGVRVEQPGSALCDPEYQSHILEALRSAAVSYGPTAVSSLERKPFVKGVDAALVSAVLHYFVRSVASYCGANVAQYELDRAPETPPALRLGLNFFEALTDRARVVRLRAPEHLGRAGLLGADQKRVDHILVDFINFIARRSDIDYHLYPAHLGGEFSVDSSSQ